METSDVHAFSTCMIVRGRVFSQGLCYAIQNVFPEDDDE